MKLALINGRIGLLYAPSPAQPQAWRSSCPSPIKTLGDKLMGASLLKDCRDKFKDADKSATT